MTVTKGLNSKTKMDTSWLKLFYITILASFVTCEEQANTDTLDSSTDRKKLYTLEGSVDVDGVDITIWGPKTRVLVDAGKYLGFIKSTGEFQIVNIPSGSYTVEVVTPNHVFDPVRVDVSGKTGKIRARKLNLIKPNAVSSLAYPLKFHTSKQAPFFQKREPWNILGMLKNPMVLLMLAPVLIMLVLPKLMNTMDKDTQKEMQQSMQAFQQPGSTMPSLEEMFTNFFGGGRQTNPSKKPTKKSKH